jgi:hypothetical protein
MTICETTGAGVGLKRDRPTEASGKRAKRAHVVGGSAKRRSPRWATGDDSTITASVRTCVNESGDKRIRGDPCDLADSNMSPPRAGSNGRSRSLSPFRENSLERRDQRFVQEPGWRQRASAESPLDPFSRCSCGRDVQRVVCIAMGHASGGSIGCRTTCKVKGARG